MTYPPQPPPPPAAPPPPVGPPVGGPPPAATGPPQGGSSNGPLIALGATAGGLVIVGVIAAAVVILGGGGPDDSEILLEPIGHAGPSPFSPPASPDPDSTVAAFATQGPPEPTDAALAADRPDPAAALEQRNGQLAVSGTAAGVFASPGPAGACDPDIIARHLSGDPDTADAWAGVFGIDAAEIPQMLESLTALYLGADTQVVNHVLVDGDAVPYHAVLQRGTAVLIDVQGAPRVRCASGSPLAEATSDPDDADIVGQSWGGFSEDTVIVVESGPEPVESFDTINVETGEPEQIPAGTSGSGTVPGTAEPDDVSEPDDEIVLADPDGCEPFTVDGQHYQVVIEHHELWEGNEACDVVSDLYGRHNIEAISAGETTDLTCEPSIAAVLEGDAASCRTGSGAFTIYPLDGTGDALPPQEDPEPDVDASEPLFALDDDFCPPVSVDGTVYQIAMHWYDSNDGLQLACAVAADELTQDIRAHHGDGQHGDWGCIESVAYLIQHGYREACGTSWFDSSIVALGPDTADLPEPDDEDGVTYCDPIETSVGEYQIGLPDRYLEQGFLGCADFAVLLGSDLSDHLVMGLAPPMLDDCQPSFDALGGGQEISCSFGVDYLLLRPAGA